MRLLALDIATKTGWAHSSGLSGTWDFRVGRDESADMRLVRFQGKLNEIKNGIGVDLIAFESGQVHVAHLSGILVQAEMVGIMKLWCKTNEIQYIGLNITSIKRHATGKGNAGKELMLEAARKRWPEKNIETHDEADALWILDLFRTKIPVT
jgi:Holliday junction resolvasome RuvABC endonuclease subunit